MAEIMPEITESVQAFVSRVAAQVLVDAAYLFGSQVKGTAGTWGDVDLAIISPAFGKNLIEDMTVLARAKIQDPTSRIIALPFSRKEYEELPWGSFLREVIKNWSPYLIYDAGTARHPAKI
jgi:predicted nucleotidyltransferase